MQADLEAVEFSGIRRLIERLTATPYGADAAAALEPAPEQATAQRMQAAVSAARQAIEAGSGTLSRVPDIRAALRQSAQAGSALPVQALFHVGQLMAAMRPLAERVTRYPGLYPGDLADLAPPQAVEAALEGALHPNGRLRDEASPELKVLAGEVAYARAHVEDILKKKLLELKLAGRPEEGIASQGARLLLAVPAAVAQDIKGVRRGPAAHGQRQLIEPLEAVAANNRLETLNGQRDAEEFAIRRRLTAIVQGARADLERLIGAIAWIDLAFAGGHLSVHLNASPVEWTRARSLKLAGATHPAMLLAYADKRGPLPVPLSITLDGEQPMLLITGPNTGGKTVALKTVGLLVAMAYCGLHLPTEGTAVVGDFSRLVVDIGDRQSLLHHLSTFAAHVEVLKRLLGEADEGTLVLMDELGTGTDPEEGAALAMAVLDELAARSVRGVITTHLSPLKAYAERHPYLSNATMVFDAERLAPTYALRVGESGSSHGLVIAGRSGLPEPLLARARDHLARIAPRQGDA